MNRVTLAAIALVSALAAPIAVNATSRPEAALVSASPAASQVEGTSCGRRVRVVYAGYGEAGATACALAGLARI
jgi:hypothetical protein